MCIHEGKQCEDWDNCSCPHPCENCDKPLVIGFGLAPEGRQFYSQQLLARLKGGKSSES